VADIKPKPFSQQDIEKRAGWEETKQLAGIGDEKQQTLFSSREAAEICKLAGVASEQADRFIAALAAEHDVYSLSQCIAERENPTTVGVALQEGLEACERFRGALVPMPLSVRATMFEALGMGEPTKIGIERLRTRIEFERSRRRGHRKKAVTPELVVFARSLQIIACSYAPTLKDEPARLKLWLERLLEVTGFPPPGKNRKTQYYKQLLCPISKLHEALARPPSPIGGRESHPNQGRYFTKNN
jgi:hypothetical protein